MLTVNEMCVKPHGAECRRCAIACPMEAISFADNLPVIDEARCTKCGICMGICDAFTTNSTTTLKLYEHLRRVAMKGEIVYLTCKENVFPGLEPADNVTVLPCLACMPVELWTLLLAQNVPLCVAADLKYCDTCDRAPGRGELLFTRAIELAEAQTGGEVHWDREMPEASDEKKQTQENQYGRRDAFGSIATDALDIVNGKRRLRQSSTLKDMYRKRERQRMQSMLNLSNEEILRKPSDKGATGRILQPRRRMLLEALVSKPEMAQTVDMVVSATNHNACVVSLDCTAHCPTGARSIAKNGTDLVYDARYCIGCGACVDACPTAAVVLLEATAADLMPNGPGEPAVELEFEQ